MKYFKTITIYLELDQKVSYPDVSAGMLTKASSFETFRNRRILKKCGKILWFFNDEWKKKKAPERAPLPNPELY